MADLTDFLLARIAEDEAAARLGAGEPTYLHHGDSAAEESLDMAEGEGCNPDGAAHFRRWMPARVLAECEAKRRIVERFRWAVEQPDLYRNDMALMDQWQEAWDTVADLALPYASHPDYDEAWRP